MTLKPVVKLTANFERNLGSIEQFLLKADAPQAFDSLIEDLLDKVLPNLERFPDMGASFLELQPGSIESLNAQEALRKRAGNTEVRQYVLPNYLILYAVAASDLYLLSIKHHRQLSFDLDAIWLANPKGHSSRKSGEK